ncbi:ABC transporter permease [Amnibacterium endophyticum]|uniref:ABC transporter permease n=1 Tax=Amnibacterium endophyticum TaxID=2109337 RepID=A0ABW4LFP2_9MICO
MTATIERDGQQIRLSPGRVLRAEWLKLTTVRSTFWTSAVALVLAALAAVALGLTFSRQEGAANGGVSTSVLLIGSTISLSFVGLVVGVLGVLSIGGEYATQQIRSSYTAVPRRWPALVAKGVVVGLWSFALGLVITFGSFGLLALFFGARGLTVSLTGDVVGGLVGGAAYLAVIGVFAVGLGALVRSSAAGITALTALLFVAPIILNLLAALLRADWAARAGDFLLSSAGSDLYAAPGNGGLQLWAAALTLAVWVAAVWLAGIVSTQRRDV